MQDEAHYKVVDRIFRVYTYALRDMVYYRRSAVPELSITFARVR